MAKTKFQFAKLPPNPDEIARKQEFRALLKELIEIGAELARAEALQGIAEANAAIEAAQNAPPPEPAPTRNPPNPKQNPEAPTPPKSAEPPRPLAPPPTKGRAAFTFAYLLRAIEAAIRLDGKIAAEIAAAHTNAELAGLSHPCRQDMLAYLHNAARIAKPHEDRRDLHQELETRVSEELAINPHRNPADIIGEICCLFDLPFDDADFPHNWRCETFIPPPPENPDLPEDLDERIAELCRLEAIEATRPKPRYNSLE